MLEVSGEMVLLQICGVKEVHEAEVLVSKPIRDWFKDVRSITVSCACICGG